MKGQNRINSNGGARADFTATVKTATTNPMKRHASLKVSVDERKSSAPRSQFALLPGTSIPRPMLEENEQRVSLPEQDLNAIRTALDETDSNWSFAIKQIREIGSSIIVTVRLSVLGVSRDGVGMCDQTSQMKSAETAALVDAALKFRTFRTVLFVPKEGRCEAVTDTLPHTDNQPVIESTATSMTDLVTPRQLGAILSLARSTQIDIEKECFDLLNCRTEDLSRPAASKLISHLRNMSSANNQALRKVG